jgi:hypothetical protein
MRVARGKVVGNSVVLEEVRGGKPPAEGQSVTVYIDEDGWQLDGADTRELLDAMGEADRGETVSAEEVFAGLPPRTAR